MDPDTLKWVIPSWLALLISTTVTIVTLYARIKSSQNSTTTVEGDGRGEKIKHTLSVVREFNAKDFIAIRSKAWAVRKEVVDRTCPVRPIVQHLLGETVDQNSPLSEAFPFDETLKHGLSHFQCVAQIVAYWETFYIMKEEKLLHPKLLWPLKAHYQQWHPLLNALVEDARQYTASRRPKPPCAWIEHLAALDTVWDAE